MPEHTQERSIRLQLFLARAGIASRRTCESYIASGRITVNGEPVVEQGMKVGPGDDVRCDGKSVRMQMRRRYILLNKPAGYLCSMSDPQGRPLASDLLPPGIEERIYHVGRLDQWSSGLILFTNDGELAALLGHPSNGIEKEYSVIADLPIPDAFVREFLEGVVIDGIRYRARSIRMTGERSATITLVEGRNRELRRVLEAYGIRVLRLCRIRIGPILIDGLVEGTIRELAPDELTTLKHARGSGETGNKPAGKQ